METTEKIDELAKALVAFHKSVGKVVKDSDNPFFKSKYASLGDIHQVIDGPLSDAGLVVTHWPEGEHNLTTRLLHESGQWMQATYVMAPTKNDPQGRGSALTYQQRYAIGAILSLNIDDDDDGNAASRPVRQDKPPKSKPAELSGEVKAMIDDYTAMIDAAVTTESLEKIGKTLADKPEAVRYALATPYRKRMTTLKESKPVATITAADAAYIADAMAEIENAKSLKELEAIGFNFANKSPAVRHALAKTYTDKLTNFAKEEAEDGM